MEKVRIYVEHYGSVRKRNKEKERSSQQGGAVRSFMEEK